MPPIPVNPAWFPKTIYGIHDLEAAGFLSQAGCTGWLIHTVKLDTDPPTDYSPFLSSGHRVIVRLNNDYGGTGSGTIPLPDRYDWFAQQCANWVARSKGMAIWMIGNEPNHPAEYPAGQFISPQMFAACFKKCRAAIHALAGHANDPVIPGGVAPWNPDQGDWVRYFQNLYTLLDGECDGISLHTYSHGNTPDTITDESKFGRPFQNDHYNFRTYRDFLGVVPATMRGLPVFITEAQTVTADGPSWTHQNTGWVQAAFSEISAWSAVAANQAIQALILFRWKVDGNPPWAISNYPEIQADLRTAMQKNYSVVLPRSTLAPTLSDVALARARSVTWMPVNNGAALWKYAKAHGLEDQQTDELSFTFNGEPYIVQVFNKGVVYAKVGDWGNVKVIPK